jgi:Ner family transcriptional regulator
MDYLEQPAELPEPEVLADTKRRAAWIIYQLKLRGTNLAALGRQYGKGRNYPGNALRRPWPLWEWRIAKALGREPQEIFPERYHPDGLPIHSRGLPLEFKEALKRSLS